MMESALIKNIIFLSLVTSYNVPQIYSLLSEEDILSAANKIIKEEEGSGDKADYKYKKLVEDTERYYEECRFRNIQIIPYTSPKYPIQLKQIKDMPPLLFLRGTIKNGPLAGIVGTRDASEHGVKLTRYISKIFIENNFGIVSGLAKGIDYTAHSIAVEMKGYTLSILPTPLDNIYPKEHYKIANEILDSGGGLISELPLGIQRGKKAFVQRNRILSAISDVVVPIEMDINSGTMHTISFAKRQKKLILLLKEKSMELAKRNQYKGIEFLINDHLSKNSQSPYCLIQNTQELLNSINAITKSPDSNSSSNVQLNLFSQDSTV